MNYVNEELMVQQENHDFELTKKVFERIFGHKLKNIVPTPKRTSVDVRATASTKHNYSEYAIEIKSNKREYLEQYNAEFPLLLRKYKNMLRCKRENEKLILVYLLPRMNAYVIYDLSNLDLDNVKRKDWVVARENFSTRKEDIYDCEETLLFPLKDIICSGSTI